MGFSQMICTCDGLVLLNAEHGRNQYNWHTINQNMPNVLV